MDYSANIFFSDEEDGEEDYSDQLVGGLGEDQKIVKRPVHAEHDKWVEEAL